MRGEVRSIGAKQLTKVQYANAESNPIHAFFLAWLRARAQCVPRFCVAATLFFLFSVSLFKKIFC